MDTGSKNQKSQPSPTLTQPQKKASRALTAVISNLPTEWQMSPLFKSIPLDSFVAGIDTNPELEMALDRYFFQLLFDLSQIYK